MNRILRLPYGIKDGELVTIDEVESGLACGCICQCCGKQLVAKKGEINIDHFAHYKSSDCAGALQTALHSLCKKIIDSSATFTTPALYFSNIQYEIAPEYAIPIKSVQLEKKVGNIVPDIIIETSYGKKLLVEIVVTNVVDEEKRRKIREQNIAVVCIYAPELINSLFQKKNFRLTDDIFRKELIEGTKYKYWIHNPKLEAIYSKLRSKEARLKTIRKLEYDYGWFYYVDNCPLQKRTWRGGFKQGKPYASIEDCNKCVYDISALEPWTETVYCIGHIKQNLKKILGIQ